MTTDKQIDDLLLCPFCGAGETTVREGGRIWMGTRYGEPTSVSVIHWCDKIDGQPSRMIERIGRDEVSARAAWNRRATTAPVVEKEANASRYCQSCGNYVAVGMDADHEDWCSEFGWKKRALEAEELNRRFMESVNGPTHMGEPAQSVPVACLFDGGETAEKWTQIGNLHFDGPNAAQLELAAKYGWKWIPLYAHTPAQTADVRAMTMQRHADMYQWLRRRALMIDASDDGVIVLTLMRDEGPTGEFLDDQIAALSQSTGENQP